MPAVVPENAVSQYAVIYQKIEALQAEAGRLLKQVQAIYAQIGAAAAQADTGRVNAPVAGRMARVAKRAPRGALKAAIRKVLAGGKAVRPAEIVRQLPKVGYRSASSPRVLYTSVYLACKRDDAVKKTGEGFQLKAGGKK